MTTSHLFTSPRHQFAAFGAATAITLSLLTSLGQLANGYHNDAQVAAAPAAGAASQVVLVVGQRATGG